jgi:hypothetical protein
MIVNRHGSGGAGAVASFIRTAELKSEDVEEGEGGVDSSEWVGGGV